MIPGAGRKFGPYEIQGPLGGGGMGEVFRAWDSRLQREVAIKLLRNVSAMPGMRERFLREARAASALNHPNICTIFDMGEQDGDPFLVMELLQGGTLKSRIARSPVPVSELVSIALDVAEALTAAHSKGVVHRDIKPENIFLVDQPNGSVQAKVLDFGLAKMDGRAARAEGNRDLTGAGAAVGTLAYMSPEQARGEMLDLRSDLFSLGVVMYEMATRHTPFQGATSALVFVQLLNHPPDPAREWNPALPRDLEKIIFKLLAKERTARFQTARELAGALMRLQEKPAGGWLRKAIFTAPLVRPSDLARENRAPRRRRSSRTPTHLLPRGDVSGLGVGQAPSRAADQPAQVVRPLKPPTAEEIAGAFGSTVARRTPAPGERVSGDGLRFEPPPLEQQALPARERYHPNHDDLFPPVHAIVLDGAVRREAFEAVRSRTSVRSLREADGSTLHRDAPVAGTRVDAAAGPELPASNLAAETGEEILEDFGEDEPPTEQSLHLRRFVPWLFAAVALVVLGAGLRFFLTRGGLNPPLLGDHDLVVLGTIENRTGNRMLDGSVARGLEIALTQSPYLRLAGGDAFRAALRLAAGEDDSASTHARLAAHRLGAKAYLSGHVGSTSAVAGNGVAYNLHVELLDASTNQVLGSMDEQAASLQQIPAAVDRLADDIRATAGESASSIGQTHHPLSREGTANLAALHALAAGEAASANGQRIEALGLFQQAATLEPRFVQAQLRLAQLYRTLGAEVWAAESARLAVVAAGSTSERMRALAQAEYEMDASGDLPAATSVLRRLLSERGRDPDALVELAHALRLQGHLQEALGRAQQAYAADAFNGDAYAEAEDALIRLDRPDSALEVAQQAQQLGLAPTGGNLVASALAGREDPVDKGSPDEESSGAEALDDAPRGLLLDSAGRLREGLAAWRSSAAAADKINGLASRAASLLAQGALDRALAGACGDAVALAHGSGQRPQGVKALFNAGMAGALCGDGALAEQATDKLGRMYPQSSAVQQYLLPDLKGAIALGAGDPELAVKELRPARPYDLLSLTPYLRGLAHVQLRQMQIGIVDFQMVLSHRGLSFTLAPGVYPMAQLGVARAFAELGDPANSAEGFRQFLELWKGADAGLAPVIEARKRLVQGDKASRAAER